MILWLWRILWGTSKGSSPTPSRHRLHILILELSERVERQEGSLKKLWGRMTGGLRVGDTLEVQEDPPELELEDESRSLGARARWGKEV